MSNVSVYSAITGQLVASFDTESETLESVKAKAMTFREISTANAAVQLELIGVARQVFATPVDSTIRNATLSSVGIDRVEVKVTEDAPDVEDEATPEGVDVVVNSAVLNAPIAEFNTGTETLESLTEGALQYHEVRNADFQTRAALEGIARDVLADSTDRTIANEALASVGIASVVVGNGGESETPIHDALVEETAEETVKPLTLEKSASAPVVSKFASSVPTLPATEYKPVERKAVVKPEGAKVPVWVAAVAAAAGVVAGALVNWF